MMKQVSFNLCVMQFPNIGPALINGPVEGILRRGRMFADGAVIRLDADNIIGGQAAFINSGAERVVWLQSPGGDDLENALRVALSKMSGLKGVIIEGNSPLFHLNPFLVIFIISDSGEIKTSGIEACKKADIVIVNSEIQTKNLSFSAYELKEHAKIFRIDLKNRKGEIDKFLAYVREYTL